MTTVVVEMNNTIIVENASRQGTVFISPNTFGGGGSGDMQASVYDPQNISGDAFDRANHTGTQPMESIGNKQGKVLDDLTPLMVEDLDSAVVPKGYLVSDLGGNLDGAQLFVQQTQEGLLLQTMHIPLLGKSAFRTKPVGGAWSDFAFTIAPFDIINWHGNTTASAADAVINADGSFSREVSTEEWKREIEPMQDSYADAIVHGAVPIYYRSKCAADPKDWSYWGISAEQLATIDPRLVHWGHSTKEVPQSLGLPPKTVPDLDSPLKPIGVQYSRLVVPLLQVVKRQGDAIAALEARITALESKP